MRMKIFVVTVYAVLLFSGIAFASNSQDRSFTKNRIRKDSSLSSSSEEDDQFFFRSNKKSNNGLTQDCMPYDHAIEGLQMMADKYHYTDASVERVVRGMCDNILTAKHKPICNKFIDDKKLKFFEIYRSHEATVVAKELGLCTGGATYNRVTETMKGIYCSPCKWAMSTMKDLIGSGMTLGEFKTVLHKALHCQQMPWPVSTACKEAVEHYGEKLYILLKNNDPGTTCKEVQLC